MSSLRRQRALFQSGEFLGDTASSAGSSGFAGVSFTVVRFRFHRLIGAFRDIIGHSALVITEASSVNISWLDDEGVTPGLVGNL